MHALTSRWVSLSQINLSARGLQQDPPAWAEMGTVRSSRKGPYSMMRSRGLNGDRESRPSRLTTCKEQHHRVSPSRLRVPRQHLPLHPLASSCPDFY